MGCRIGRPPFGTPIIIALMLLLAGSLQTAMPWVSPKCRGSSSVGFCGGEQCSGLTRLLSRSSSKQGSSPNNSHQMKKAAPPPAEPIPGSNSLRVGIVKARWNKEIVNNLAMGVRKSLERHKVDVANVVEVEVPGSYELPFATKVLTMSSTVDVVVAIGCLIKGDTMHFEYIADAVSKGLMKVQLEQMIPVVFGVLTCMTEAQAVERSSGDGNHGLSWGDAAVEMALLRDAAYGGLSRGEVGFTNRAAAPRADATFSPET